MRTNPVKDHARRPADQQGPCCLDLVKREWNMRLTRWVALGWLLLGFTSLAPAADSGPPPVGEEARVAWLKKHVVPLRSIKPDDEDFSDLEPIRKAIGDARIVQLGEQSHGD